MGMDAVTRRMGFFWGAAQNKAKQSTPPAGEQTLCQAAEGVEYRIRAIETDDEELRGFLFTLGCYAGAPITVVSRLHGGCGVAIKDGRYNIDDQLAAAILI